MLLSSAGTAHADELGHLGSFLKEVGLEPGFEEGIGLGCCGSEHHSEQSQGVRGVLADQPSERGSLLRAEILENEWGPKSQVSALGPVLLEQSRGKLGAEEAP